MSKAEPFRHNRLIVFRGVRIMGNDRDDGSKILRSDSPEMEIRHHVVRIPFEHRSNLLYSLGVNIAIEQNARRIS